MLTEEAHHLFVGESGVQPRVQRACELMKTAPGGDVRAAGGIDLPTLQKYVHLWYPLSLDLFGGEISSNASDAFTAGLKGRYRGSRYSEHNLIGSTFAMDVLRDSKIAREDVPMRTALNEVLRDRVHQGLPARRRSLEQDDPRTGHRLRGHAASNRFHRQIGMWATQRFAPDGTLIDQATWDAKRDAWLPTAADETYIKSLMKPVYEPGKLASWIAPPTKGINDLPGDFEYVKLFLRPDRVMWWCVLVAMLVACRDPTSQAPRRASRRPRTRRPRARSSRSQRNRASRCTMSGGSRSSTPTRSHRRRPPGSRCRSPRSTAASSAHDPRCQAGQLRRRRRHRARRIPWAGHHGGGR